MRLKISTKGLVNIFFFFSLLPYISLVPLGSDIQIVSGLVAYMVIFVLALRENLLFDKRELFLLFLCFIFIFHADFGDGSYQFRKAIGPLYAFGVFYVAKRYNQLFDKRILVAAVAIYFFSAIVQLISPELFSLTLERFIRVSKYDDTTGRGLTSLTTESGFLGFIAIYLTIILKLLYKGLPRDRSYYITLGMLILLIILSKSGGGYVLLFLYLVYNSRVLLVKYWRGLSLAGISLFIIILASPINFQGSNKGIIELIRLMEVRDLKMVLYNPSLSVRVNPVIVGWYGFLDNPAGNGSGTFPRQALTVYYKHDINKLYLDRQQERLIFEMKNDSVSAVGKYFFEYGIFFMVYLVALFAGINYHKIDLYVLSLLIIGLLFSLPIVYPPTWIIVGLLAKLPKRLQLTNGNQGFIHTS